MILDKKILMEPICGVPKILQKRTNIPTFVGVEGVKDNQKIP